MSYLFVGCILILAFLTIMSDNINKLRRDIYRLNSNIEKITEHLGIPDENKDKMLEELNSLISEGNQVKAIKRYREYTGASLLDAKQYIDNLLQSENLK
ncbi:hypothetical protein SAMN02745163_00972 [Clostridium cavendishii DSM 21758]|uniref:Ribosomal protein L7/L12 C-terminal domain-containing protein n=2 Tax=Clostridium TaxID=1485 RepID=A0A1M6EX78_9CLOT|nr:hypothetical protein SAMN02745163_00972 [Clostridium cavendishii DSM 21758]